MSRIGRSPIAVPSGVSVAIEGRSVTVTGPKGTLERAFKGNSFSATQTGNNLHVEIWFGKRAQLACLRTITTHIENMIKGVTKGERRERGREGGAAWAPRSTPNLTTSASPSRL